MTAQQFSDLVKEIQSEAMRLHTPALTMRLGNVCKLWHDGEVTMEKSGEGRYGSRRMFTINPAIPGLKIPMPVVLPNGNSYAVMESIDAHHLADMMLLID